MSELVDRPVIQRGQYEWRMNQRGMFAWFVGDQQETGAYREHSEFDYAFSAACLKETDPDYMDEGPDFSNHPEFSRTDQVYGDLDVSHIDEVIDSMTAEIDRHHVLARREFNGNGGRRTSAAVSAEAAREISQERLLLKCYRDHKFPNS